MPGISAPAQKLEALHADTCLPDYWGGHHLPHLIIPVHKGMSFKHMKEALINELCVGCVCGADAPAENDEQWFRAAKIAVGNIQLNAEVSGHADDFELFTDLEPDDDDDATIYAYFVFKEAA